MKIKSFLARPYASIIHSKVRKGMLTAVTDQQAVLQHLLKHGSKTLFGKDHNLHQVKTYEDYIISVRIIREAIGDSGVVEKEVKERNLFIL